jgi:hypothetical protein
MPQPVLVVMVVVWVLQGSAHGGLVPGASASALGLGE